MKKIKCNRGQALLEFILLLPILITFLWYMMHVSMSINKSIVAQKHARSQVFLRLMNHAAGPQRSPDMQSQDRSGYFIGVANEVIVTESDNQTAPVVTLGVGFKPKPKTGANDDPGEPEPGSLRQRVRVRTAFGLCTPQKRLKTGDGFTDYCATDNKSQ
jgi:hypothetical protein